MARAALWRRIGIGVLVVAALLLALGAATLGPLLLAPNRYAGTPSIEALPSYREPAAMASAWRLPAARAYAARGVEFQRNPSFCAPASIATVLNSAGGRTSQSAVINGTRYEPWFGVLLGGMTLDEAADLLRLRSGAPVRVVRAADLDTFRAELRRANDPGRRVIVNFHRGPLFGRGHGHFSPVLGYLADRDLVLVGDVNADYRPFLVRSATLWRGVDTVDEATGKARGLIVMELAAPLPAPREAATRRASEGPTGTMP